jgi:PST family polysaccharide transporter
MGVDSSIPENPVFPTASRWRLVLARLASLASHPAGRNAAWIGIEKVGRMGLSLVVGILVVRQLGPERYGSYSYTLAWATFFTPIALFGIGENTVRHLVSAPDMEGRILGTAAALRVASCLLAVLLTFFAFAAGGVHSGASFSQLGVACLSLMAYPLLVVEPFFQAHSRSRVITICGLSAGVLAAAIKVAGVYMHAPIVFFIAAHATESLLLAGTLTTSYLATTSPPRGWRFDGSIAHTLWREAAPVIIGGFAIVIYNQSDLVLLGILRDSPEEVGKYAAACRISTMWLFIPLAMLTSAAPFLYRAQATDRLLYERRLEQVTAATMAVAYVFCMVIAIFPEHILRFLFGAEFEPAAAALRVHVWSNVFAILGVAQTSWVLGNRLMWAILQHTILGALVNMSLNILVIPRYGAVGAAWTTVIAMAVVAVVAAWLRPATRRLAALQMRAMSLRTWAAVRRP